MCHLNHAIYEQISDAKLSRLHRQSHASATKGLIAMRSFHIAPDRGMSLCYFDTNENLNAAFPSMKEFQQRVAAKFEAKADAQKAITSSQSDFGDC